MAKDIELQQQLLQLYHDLAVGGHVGVIATMKKLTSVVY